VGSPPRPRGGPVPPDGVPKNRGGKKPPRPSRSGRKDPIRLRHFHEAAREAADEVAPGRLDARARAGRLYDWRLDERA